MFSNENTLINLYFNGELPREIDAKLNGVFNDVNDILGMATGFIKTNISEMISFTYENAALGSSILANDERLLQACFIAKYDHLPVLNKIDIKKFKGKYILDNIGYIRHLLNEYRQIIQNKNGSIYYIKINKFCRNKLLNTNPELGLTICVRNDKGNNYSQELVKILDEHTKAITTILRHSEFGYIFNGILQHSDHQYTDRFWEEYHSGELNYIFIKHALLLNSIKEFLMWHYGIINFFGPPRMGAL